MPLKTPGKFKFFFHFNKPKTLQLGEVIWSVHFKGKCHFVKHIVFHKLNGCSKSKKRQPRAVIEGYANDIKIKNDMAYIA